LLRIWLRLDDPAGIQRTNIPMRSHVLLAVGLVAVAAPALAQALHYEVIPLGMSITGPEQLTFGAWFLDYQKGKAFSCAVTRTPAELTGICHDHTPDKGSMLTGANVQSAIPQLAPSPDAGIGGVWQADRAQGRLQFCYLPDRRCIVLAPG
jgi:hypothetical protein